MSKDSVIVDGDRVQGAPGSRVVPWSFGDEVPEGWVWVHPDMAGEALGRVVDRLRSGSGHDFVVETPGGTLTADKHTNALRDIIEEHEPEGRPIPLAELGVGGAAGRHVVQDLIPDGQLVTIVGEEGEGKSTLGWQIACEVSSGQPVGGYFEVREPVAPVLIVDVEQTEDDAVILRNRSLENPDDKKWLTHWVRALRPKLIILDTGTEAVTKPREDESVKPLFIALHGYLKNDGVRAVILLAQPRKRSQDAPSSRRFDDLFGSRVWKGRSSAALYLEQERLTVWKQRGGYLKRRWGATVGRIVRSDTEPTRILGPESAAEAEAEAEHQRRATILSTVAAEPGSYSKSSLIEAELGISGRDRPAWRKTVDALIREGKIRTDGRYSKLYPRPVSPDPAPVVGADYR